MQECAVVHQCIFFNEVMRNMPGTGALFKHDYCRGDFASCARYRVSRALGRPMVPRDLFPNQRDRANAIIERPPNGETAMACRVSSVPA